MLSLTERFDALWDETKEHRVLVTQDMEALRADMRTVLANQAIILQQQQSLQTQIAQLLAYHQPPPPPPQWSPGESPSSLLFVYCQWGQWIFFLGGGGGGGGGEGGVGGDRIFCLVMF